MENNSNNINLKYAGFWVRLAAFIIDGIILSVPILASLWYFKGGFLLALAWTAIVYIYSPIMIANFGATLGKMLVGLIVLRTNGESISLGRAFLREFSKIFSSFGSIGFIMIAFMDKKQGLHDLIADTVVLEKHPEKSKTSWVIFAVAMIFIFPILGFAASFFLVNLNFTKQQTAEIQQNNSQDNNSNTQKIDFRALEGEFYDLVKASDNYYKNNNGGYLGFCVDSTTEKILNNFPNQFVCNDSSDSWAAALPIEPGVKYACMDNTGNAAILTQQISNTDTTCNNHKI